MERMCQNHQILRNRFFSKSPYLDNGVLRGCQNIGGFKFLYFPLWPVAKFLLVDDYQCGYCHKTEEKQTLIRIKPLLQILFVQVLIV